MKQCILANSFSKSLINLKTVFVSPLRRALQTSYLLFKDHPNFKNIKFVIHPDLREIVHTVCDVPDNYENVLSEFNGCFNKLGNIYQIVCSIKINIFNNIDLSLMDKCTGIKDYWFIP